MQDLLQLMYQDGHLSSTELAALQRASRQLKENPIRVLRSLNILTPGEIKYLLQRYYGFSAATDKLIEEVDDSLRSIVPADIALHYCVLPIAEEGGEIYVLMEDPTDKGAISQLQFLLDKKIVPVIATAQQLSSGLCRLYGVEPGRLKLSGVLETSRGAVGMTGLGTAVSTHFVDDTQPLLDDDVFVNLKQSPKTHKKKARLEALRPRVGTLELDAEPRTAVAREQAHSHSANTTSRMEAHTTNIDASAQELQLEPSPSETASQRGHPTPTRPPHFETQDLIVTENRTQSKLGNVNLEPDFVAAINLLGLNLSLVQGRNEAVRMINSRLSDYAFTLHLLENNSALIVWSGSSFQVPLASIDSLKEVPQQFRILLKKISQCQDG